MPLAFQLAESAALAAKGFRGYDGSRRAAR
jgi:hypothetical protein